MKPAPFAYERPRDLKAALAVMAGTGGATANERSCAGVA